jgi:hypothetical protein
VIFKDKQFLGSDWQDANSVDNERAVCEDNAANYWVYECANNVYTEHASFTYFMTEMDEG